MSGTGGIKSQKYTYSLPISLSHFSLPPNCFISLSLLINLLGSLSPCVYELPSTPLGDQITEVCIFTLPISRSLPLFSLYLLLFLSLVLLINLLGSLRPCGYEPPSTPLRGSNHRSMHIHTTNVPFSLSLPLSLSLSLFTDQFTWFIKSVWL